MATKADIAKLAQVSPATVSNFFTHAKRVSPDVQKRIREAAEALHYPLPEIPAEETAPLQVVLVVDDLLNPHYGSILKGMSSTEGINASVSMMLIWDDVEAFCRMLVRQKVFAVYFATYNHKISEQSIAYLQSHGVEVFFSWNNFIIDIDSLMLKTVQYLVDLGHTKIAYLSGLPLSDPMNERYTAFIKALETCRIPVRRDLILDGVYPYYTDAKSGYWVMKSYLNSGPVEATAVIALNDPLATGAIRAIYERGLKVPDDISVIGCDDTVLAEYSNPPLTTMHLSADDIGSRTMYAILQRSRGEEIHPVTLQTSLIIRQSTGKVRK